MNIEDMLKRIAELEAWTDDANPKNPAVQAGLREAADYRRKIKRKQRNENANART